MGSVLMLIFIFATTPRSQSLTKPDSNPYDENTHSKPTTNRNGDDAAETCPGLERSKSTLPHHEGTCAAEQHHHKEHPILNEEEEELIRKQYGGLFVDMTLIDKIDDTENKDDGDSCCRTSLDFWFENTTKDVDSKEWAVVHLPDSQQLVTIGKCVEGGSCKYHCVQEVSLRSVLVHDSEAKIYPKVNFKKVKMPSYCSCKNVGT
ncbi:hypothetical protein ScPMuIL_015817 [Solemya velum]